MPIEYRIDHDRRLVIAKGHGQFTDRDVFDYQRTVWSRPDVAGFDELIDMLDVEHVDIPSTDRMRDLVELSAGMDLPCTHSKFAVVASNEIAYQLGRMYEALRGLDQRSTKEVAVDLDEAMKWLECK
jgi:hypothetical protein